MTPRRKPTLAKLATTPGGTCIPAGTPPQTPPSVEHVTACERPGGNGTFQGDNARDFIPGERTMWELPKLGAPGESNPALRCSDWLHRIQPSIQDLAPRAHYWWSLVLQEAKSAYQKWTVATPLERIAITGNPSEELRAERFLRLESRTLAMLSKAVPASIFDHALSVRNTTCCGIVFFVLKAYQPGGLHERTELLKGLTVLGECANAKQAVESLNIWTRHLERARSMDVAVPDCTLLLDALDTMTRPLLDRCPALLFRINSIRMTLQLDTVPSLTAVEQYAKSLTAELEVISVSRDDGSTAKKAKVAAMATSPGAPPKGPGKGAPPPVSGDGGSKKGAGRSKIPCNGWITDSGCRFGKSCQFSHDAERPQKCWVCGGAHQKAECTAPGGGKGPAAESKAKAKAQALSASKEKAKPESKTSQKAPSKNEPGKAGAETAAAIKEATQLLQSMRAAKVDHIRAVTQLKDLGEGRRRKGLIDGGATACLRTAKGSERSLPTMKVELACGSCTLHINPAGTLLSPHPVTPIVSVSALLELGFRISWTKESCLIQHHTRGHLPVDASSGCPEIDFDVALELISEYEELVKDRDVHEARVRCILADMTDSSDEELADSVWGGGVEAAAALRLLAARLFPHVPERTLEQVPPGLGPQSHAGGWNRRARRRAEKSEGVIVHFSDGESRKMFQEVADRCGWTLLHVETVRTTVSEAMYGFLMSLAQKGQIRGIIGSPPIRSFLGFRWAADDHNDQSIDPEMPVRIRGKSLGCEDGLVLSGPEAAARRCDDRLVLRMLLLFATAARVGQKIGLPSPAFVLEQPEDQPEKGMPSLWATPEWEVFAEEFGVEMISFDQGPLLHSKRRPTTLASNIVFPSSLVECRGPGMDVVQGVKTRVHHRESGATWAPGLTAAVADMIWYKCKAGSKAPLGRQAKALDASFIEHIKQGHVPYRNDCKFCIRGSARRKQHRRVLCPEAWCLSVDSAGPYKRGSDEASAAQKYMIVGVLTVPILELQDRGEEAVEEVMPSEEIGGAIDDEEFLADGEDEPDDPATQKEIAEAKASKTSWDELVERDQRSWMKEAEKDYLPRVKLIEWPFVEVVPNKTQQNVLNAIRKMRSEALSLGFEIRRIHTDRGREYLNNGLKGFCNQHSIVKTLAFAEEHQSNGRVESLIGRIKAKTRVFLEQGSAPPEEWPMAAKLSGLVLQNVARKALHMKPKPIIPYNTQVQVVQRSWRRGAWHSITVAAQTKGPSGESDRGWVVVTSDGNYLTTSKVFPTPEDEKKLLIKYEGDPVDPEAPDRRVRGKSAVRHLATEVILGKPMHDADRLAKSLLEKEDFSPQAVAKIALAVGKLPPATQGSVPMPVKLKDRGAVFFAGSFSYGGMTGLKNNTTEHRWVTAYLAQYLRQVSSDPFGAVGLVWNAEHLPHRDSHNQKGICNIVVPVVTSGVGLWVQDEGLGLQDRKSDEVMLEVKPGTVVKGRNLMYQPGVPIRFNASKWHASVQSKGQQLLVVGYTPRSLHKLSAGDRKALWDIGCTFIPGSQDEYWTFEPHRGLITRHHEKPRKPLFSPKTSDLPFPLEWLGNIRYCEQKFVSGDSHKTQLAVRAKWTGKSIFQVVGPNQDCVNLGGVRPPNFCLQTLNLNDCAEFVRMNFLRDTASVGVMVAVFGKGLQVSQRSQAQVCRPSNP